MLSHGLVVFRSRPSAAVTAAVLVCMALTFAVQEAASAEKKADESKPQAAVSQAVLAYQLAIQGQHTKSPILMLAACETIGVLKTKDRDARVKKETTGAKPAAKSPISLDVVEWQEKAREYAKTDKQLLALVENRIEQMNSRGILNTRAGAPTKYFGSTRYTVLDADFLPRGESTALHHIYVAGGEFACVGVVGDIESELSFTVVDESTGEEQGGNSFRGFAIYSWTPKRTHPITVRVSNNGAACSYVVIGH